MTSQDWYWKIRPWLTPGLQNSHIAYARALQTRAEASCSWLDVGCGHAFVPDWTPFDTRKLSGRRRIFGVDPDTSALKGHTGLQGGVVASGEALPFCADSFDLVTANMVLEHVENPEGLFREVFRVLKPSGVFLAHTPNASGYTTRLTLLGPPALRVRLAGALQGRQAEDVYPTFYRANTEHRLGELAAGTGFTAIVADHIESSPLFANFLPLLLPEMMLIRLMRLLGIERLRPCLLLSASKPSDRQARSIGRSDAGSI